MYLVRMNISHHLKFSFPAQVTKETEFLMCCLQMYILYLEAESSVQGRVCVRERLKGLGGKGQGPRTKAAASGVDRATVWLQGLTKGQRDETILLPSLSGIGIHERWVHFSTLK